MGFHGTSPSRVMMSACEIYCFTTCANSAIDEEGKDETVRRSKGRARRERENDRYEDSHQLGSIKVINGVHGITFTTVCP
jgi:hypothetical protein